MNSNIPAYYYFENDVFKKENDKIFSKIWHFVGFKSDFINDNDFITIRIANVPIVIQNLRGRIKCFLNVCSHRFSIIQNEKCGNRALFCPYHGWAYDKDGIPTGIPKKPLFKNFTKEELCEMKLREFQVSFCGNLVFVSLCNETIPLRTFLGSFYNELELISFSLGRNIDINSMKINSNWKIIIENTLESYHVGSIHPESLAKLEPSGLDFSFDNDNSSWASSLNIDTVKGGYGKINKFFTPRSFDIEGYKHILIFPNLLISSTHGISFNFSLIEPISPDNTKFTSYVFISKTETTELPYIIKPFEESLIKFNRQVFDEDKFICEKVQIGVKSTYQIGKLSDEEERVHHFQKKYLEYLNDES